MTASHYLGPGQSRFAPTTWEEVEIAAAAGILNEGRWVELKKEIPAKSAGSNKELAKDLASLSVDGGTLIVGIEELSSGVAGAVVGADLSSLQIRMNQVSQSTIKPPLHISTHTLPHPKNDALGVMVVSVPASASAPHMVDGSYWGRTEHGKTPLADDQVRRLMEDRRSTREEFNARLTEVGKDVGAPDATSRRTGQITLRFEPIAPAYTAPVSEAMTGFPGPAIEALIPGIKQVHSPRLTDADQITYHPDGWCATSLRKQDPRIVEATRMSVLVDDAGAWSVVSGCATRPIENTSDDSGDLCVYTKHILELTHIVCSAVARFSTEKAPYYGEWQVGVLIDNLEDAKPAEAHSGRAHLFNSLEPFPRPAYKSVVTTTTQELEEHPSQVVEKLLKNLLRGMGLDRFFLPYTDLTEKISVLG